MFAMMPPPPDGRANFRRLAEAHLAFVDLGRGRWQMAKNVYDAPIPDVLSRAQVDAIVAGYRARGSRVRVYEFRHVSN